MRPAIRLFLALAAVLAGPGPAPLQGSTDTASAGPGGAAVVPIRGQSDNFVSMPFAAEPVVVGGVSGVGANTLRLTGAAWQPNEFQYQTGVQRRTYYAQFTTGPLAGVFYRVTGNTAESLLLDTEGDSLSAHPLGTIGFGDVVKVAAYASIASLFGTDEATLGLDPRPDPSTPADDLRFFDNYAVGTSKPATVIYFLRGAGWRREGDATGADVSDRILPPGSAFAVRRRNPADTVLVSAGAVPNHRFVVFIPGGSAASGNDVYASITFPEPVLLDDSGLLHLTDPARSVLKASPTRTNVLDQLYVYTSQTVGYNPVPGTSYFHLSGQGWRRYGSTVTNVGQTVVIPPGQAILIRKKSSSPSVDWILAP